MVKLFVCDHCQEDYTAESWQRTGKKGYCSYKCMGLGRRGKSSYVRTKEHREKMSKLVRNRDQSENKKRMAKIGRAKKGKTLEEIYGEERAAQIRSSQPDSRGSKNPNWRGGIPRRYPQAFHRIRKSIIERDGFVCMECGMTDRLHRSKDSQNRGLTVHHIDYDTFNNSEENLITLCKWCNSLANGRREECKVFYQRLLGASLPKAQQTKLHT